MPRSFVRHAPGRAASLRATEKMTGGCVRSGRGSDGASPQPARERLLRHPSPCDRDEYRRELRRTRGDLAAVGAQEQEACRGTNALVAVAKGMVLDQAIATGCCQVKKVRRRVATLPVMRAIEGAVQRAEEQALVVEARGAAELGDEPGVQRLAPPGRGTPARSVLAQLAQDRLVIAHDAVDQRHLPRAAGLRGFALLVVARRRRAIPVLGGVLRRVRCALGHRDLLFLITAGPPICHHDSGWATPRRVQVAASMASPGRRWARSWAGPTSTLAA